MKLEWMLDTPLMVRRLIMLSGLLMIGGLVMGVFWDRHSGTEMILTASLLVLVGGHMIHSDDIRTLRRRTDELEERTHYHGNP